jgi:hypothetical protein
MSPLGMGLFAGALVAPPLIAALVVQWVLNRHRRRDHEIWMDGFREGCAEDAKFRAIARRKELLGR